jgi:dTDP-4-dehydrorhamnose 3,5-epimerase
MKKHNVSSGLIHGVKVKKLKVIYDDRGHLMEILRSDDEIFDTFGQVYVTTVKPQVVKAWHYHKDQDDHFVCLYGKAQVALYDSRKDSPTYGMVNEFVMTPREPILLKIPRLVYHGFKGIAQEGESAILNVPTALYNYAAPDEHRVDAFENDIDYDWKK